MKWLNLITLALLIVGGINWGLVALSGHEMDFVANMSGGNDSGMARVLYALVGLSALWQILPGSRALGIGEDRAEADRTQTPMTR